MTVIPDESGSTRPMTATSISEAAILQRPLSARVLGGSRSNIYSCIPFASGISFLTCGALKRILFFFCVLFGWLVIRFSLSSIRTEGLPLDSVFLVLHGMLDL